MSFEPCLLVLRSSGALLQVCPTSLILSVLFLQATGAVLGLCSLEVQRKQEDTQLLDQGPYNMDLEMVQAVYVGPGTAGAIVKVRNNTAVRMTGLPALLCLSLNFLHCTSC